MKNTTKRLAVAGSTLLLASSTVIVQPKPASAEPITLFILGVIGKGMLGKAALTTAAFKTAGTTAVVKTTGAVVGTKTATVVSGAKITATTAALGTGGKVTITNNLLPATAVAGAFTVAHPEALGLAAYYTQKALDGFVFGIASNAGKATFENILDSPECQDCDIQ